MDDGMDSGNPGPLLPTGVDFSNQTQAANFLSDMLDDTELQVVANAYARAFWYGIVVVIALASIINFTQKLILHSRLRSAARNAPNPARPSNVITKSFATITAVSREISYPQITPTRFSNWFKIPPLGTLLMLLAYLGFVLALEYINNDIPGAQYYAALGIRAGWLAVAQVPLLILLAGKNNLIGLFTGISYERLNVLHRWSSRVLLLLATLHFGYQNYGWSQYGLSQLEWSTDTCPPTGIAAYAVLLWINFSNLAVIRNLSYEIFVIQHLLSFFGFIVAVMYHLPSTALYSRIYIYIPICLWFLDRAVRTLRFGYHNAKPSHATLTALDGGVTKIRLRNHTLTKWSPGSFVLLSIPRFGFGQSHPATIASTPTSHDGDLIFILKGQGHKGFTRRIMTSASANSSTASLLPKPDSTNNKSNTITTISPAPGPEPIVTRIALLDGPYGGSPVPFSAFDSVLLIAGSTGITYTLSLLLHLSHLFSTTNTPPKLPLKRINFIWIVKKTTWTSWVSTELSSAASRLKSAGIDTEISIYVTCDDSFTGTIGGADTKKKCNCNCDKALGPCCCESIELPTRSTSTSDKTRPLRKNDADAELASLTQHATFHSGRPPLYPLLSSLLNSASGETGIATCGPLGLSTAVRNTVAAVSDERGSHKGTGALGVYLHVEGFAL